MEEPDLQQGREPEKLNRRSFLKLVGLAVAALAIPFRWREPEPVVPARGQFEARDPFPIVVVTCEGMGRSLEFEEIKAIWEQRRDMGFEAWAA